MLETNTPRYHYKAANFHRPGSDVVAQPRPKNANQSISQSPPSDLPPPIYHDVIDLPTSVIVATGAPNDGINSVDCHYDLPATKLNSQYSDPGPIYQEITGLSFRCTGAFPRQHEHTPTAGTV